MPKSTGTSYKQFSPTPCFVHQVYVKTLCTRQYRVQKYRPTDQQSTGSDPAKLAAAIIALHSIYGLRIIYIYTGALGKLE